jgi:hypothetical protein
VQRAPVRLPEQYVDILCRGHHQAAGGPDHRCRATEAEGAARYWSCSRVHRGRTASAATRPGDTRTQSTSPSHVARSMIKAQIRDLGLDCCPSGSRSRRQPFDQPTATPSCMRPPSGLGPPAWSPSCRQVRSSVCRRPSPCAVRQRTSSLHWAPGSAPGSGRCPGRGDRGSGCSCSSAPGPAPRTGQP